MLKFILPSFYAPNLEKIRGHIASGLSVRSFVTLSCALHNFRTMYANVLKFHIWIPHEKIGDPYFFLIQIISNKMTLRKFVLLLPSWASSVGVKQC